MVTCSQCDKELERLNFCDDACKMKYRRDSKKDPKILKTKKQVDEKLKSVIEKPRDKNLCYLCKKAYHPGRCK